MILTEGANFSQKAADGVVDLGKRIVECTWRAPNELAAGILPIECYVVRRCVHMPKRKVDKKWVVTPPAHESDRVREKP